MIVRSVEEVLGPVGEPLVGCQIKSSLIMSSMARVEMDALRESNLKNLMSSIISSRKANLTCFSDRLKSAHDIQL
jgi:hypothetical protein